jgi:hypothetical protein
VLTADKTDFYIVSAADSTRFNLNLFIGQEVDLARTEVGEGRGSSHAILKHNRSLKVAVQGSDLMAHSSYYIVPRLRIREIAHARPHTSSWRGA